MKLHIERTLKNIDGSEITMLRGNEKATARLGDVCVEALVTDSPNDQTEPGNKKYHRWNLAKRIDKAMKEESVSELQMPTEDIDLIKKRIAIVFQTKTVGPAYEAIEASE